MEFPADFSTTGPRAQSAIGPAAFTFIAWVLSVPAAS